MESACRRLSPSTRHRPSWELSFSVRREPTWRSGWRRRPSPRRATCCASEQVRPRSSIRRAIAGIWSVFRMRFATLSTMRSKSSSHPLLASSGSSSRRLERQLRGCAEASHRKRPDFGDARCRGSGQRRKPAPPVGHWNATGTARARQRRDRAGRRFRCPDGFSLPGSATSLATPGLLQRCCAVLADGAPILLGEPSRMLSSASFSRPLRRRWSRWFMHRPTAAMRRSSSSSTRHGPSSERSTCPTMGRCV